MAKLLKISGRTLGILIEWALLLIIVFAFAIRTSIVQTYIANKAAAYLSKELNAKVQVKSVAIVFIDKMALDDVLIEDQNHDTLIYAKRLMATFDELNISKKRYVIGSVDANEAFIHIQRDTNNVFNHAFLRDYFVRNKKKKNQVFFKIKSATLNDSRFRYDDQRKEKKTYGVDYWHISANNINGSVNDLQIKKDVITGKVTSLSFIEKSGFVLKSLETEANVSPRGVKLSELTLKSKGSKIETDKFDMLSNSYKCFKYFVDSVTFDAQIDKSSLDLKEVALFGYALKGMNDQVRFKSKITKKVKDLKLEDIDLRFGKHSTFRGTVNLPDYRNFETGLFHEKFKYVYIDLEELEALRLPDRVGQKHIVLNETVKRLGFIEAQSFRFDGFKEQFVIAADRVQTELGAGRFTNGIMFTENKRNNSYLFSQSESKEYDVGIINLKLGRLIGNKDIGVINGTFLLSGEAFSMREIVFDQISGDVNRFEYLNYPYTNITIKDGSYENQIFEGKVDVKDDYLDLVYDGFIDFKGKQHMKFSIDLADAFLDNINVAKRDSRMRSKFSVNITGRNPNEMQGTVQMDGFVYTSDGKEINVPSITMNVTRSRAFDRFEITSTVGTAVIEGKLDFDHLIDDFKYQFSRVFPALMSEQDLQSRKGKDDNFTYSLHMKESDEFFAVFLPDVRLAPNTEFNGHYHSKDGHFLSQLKSDSISYKGMSFENFNLSQVLDSNSINGTYHADRFAYSDSIQFHDIFFKTTGGQNKLSHELTWEGNTDTPSSVKWNTNIHDWDHYYFHLDPSYFHIKGHKWEIAHSSNVRIMSDTISVDYFELTRNDQQLLIHGKISHSNSHHLNFKLDDFEIEEISAFITDNYPMEGKLNGWGYIANPFNKFEYIGDASLSHFKVNNNEVGDVFVQSQWDESNQSIAARGDLIYKGNQTFNFDGDYYLNKKKDNLDFDLFFDYTDIQFTNAFIDPDVMSEIRGILNGTIELTGTPTSPIMDGSVELLGGSAFIDMLGVHFGVDGPIEVDEYGFYMNNIPVFDEEGNAGSLIGSVYHDNLKDFNFDLQFDLERDAINKDPFNPWKVVYLDKFLIMDDDYAPENIYYGKGYVTGEANIFGYTDNLEITVNVKTEEGTWLNIPMFGVGDIDEETDFIIFTDEFSDTLQNHIEPKFDFTGVSLDLNFDVTPDAELKIIFNEDLGDIISAKGSGDISINLDNLNNVTMDGIYTVDEGIYDFAMGIIKQKFYIENGGTINWTGNPYDANLNLRTYYQVNANISDITQEQLGTSGGAHQPIRCYLNLDESLLKPSIEFDIEAPQATDVDKSLITRVTSDKDELNRQFFSLLLWKRFQPLASSAYSGSAAADLITNQINSMLSMVSSDYLLNVAFDNDQLSGDKQYEFGVSKGFLNDRLILSGSFGVENYHTDNNQAQNDLIGDLNLEYLLNESGTFRVNIFNESTDKTVIQEAELGKFTQGAGLNYKEDFNTMGDFKALQYFLDIFRKRENKKYPIKRKKQQRPVPENHSSVYVPVNGATIEED